MSALTEADYANFREVFWAAGGYEPSTGVFPIYGVDDELITTSYGQLEVQNCPAKRILVAGGVRAGKSHTVSMMIWMELLRRNGLIWIVGPDYTQSKMEFQYILGALTRMGMLGGKPSTPERGPQVAKTAWNCRIETKSSDDPVSLASAAPDVVIGAEMGQQPEEVFGKLAERVLEKGGRVIMSGTFEGSLSWYNQKWQRWQSDNEEGGRSFSLPTWSNTAVFPGGRQDPNILALERDLNDPELFLERVAAVPYKPSGLVFRTFTHKHNVRKLDYDPALPIELCVDPGTRTYAVAAIQWRQLPTSAGFHVDYRTGLSVPKTEVRVIDEVYVHEAEAPEIIELVKNKPWFKHVTTGVIDQAGATRNQGMKSQVHIWSEEAGISLRHNYVTVRDGISVVRRRLRFDDQAGQALLLLDSRLGDSVSGGRATGAIAEFGLYKWRDWNEGQSDKNVPVDSNNHFLKALGYWLFDRFGPVMERKKYGTTKIRKYY